MASSDIYVKKTKIVEITGGKIDFEIMARVINLWTTPDRANSTEGGAIHMILLDKDLGRIHATIRKDLIPVFEDLIREGCAYVFGRFMVAKNGGSYRTTPHKYKLNFMRRTMVFKLTTLEIPMNHFDFVPFQEILSATNEDQLIDIIGHVVEKNDMKETEKNGKISKLMDAVLEDLEGNRLHCTLWDDFAVKMQQFFDTHDPSLPVVMIIQMCKLKKYLGVMGVSNSFYGSKLFLNAQIPEVTSYIERMDVANVELTQVVSQMSGPMVLSVADDLLQTPRMTIEDLIDSTKKCYGAVLAWTCEFDTDAGWFYQACTKCASRIDFMGGQLYCGKCKMPRTAVPKFRVHLQVIDDTGSITFVMFDRVVFQFLGRTAQDLLDAMNDEHTYPPELNVFVNKRMLFKVEVTDANLYRNWRGYTVKKLSDDDDIIKRFAALHGIYVGCDDDVANNSNFGGGLGDDISLGAFEGGDSTCNEVVVPSDGLNTPTSNRVEKKTSNVDGIAASATKKTSSIVEEHTEADPDSISPAKHVRQRCEIDAATEAIMVGVKTIPSKSIAGNPTIVDGVGVSATKKLVYAAGEQADPGTCHISPTKSIGKRPASVEGCEGGIGKEAKAVRTTRKKASNVDGIAASATKKPAITAGDVDTPKEVKMASVKIEGSK
ncbi:replication protein A 70 kDa DNA-binding subunit [Trifolium repens]|nr:replication protein A 70 kDa DNA-binding subunit [Trifolium repens]